MSTPTEQVRAFVQAASIEDEGAALALSSSDDVGRRLYRNLVRRDPDTFLVGTSSVEGGRSWVELRREERVLYVLLERSDDWAIAGVESSSGFARRFIEGRIPARIDIASLPPAPEGAVSEAERRMAELVGAEGMVDAPANLRLIVVSARSVDTGATEHHALAEIAIVRFEMVGPRGAARSLWIVLGPGESGGWALVQAVSAVVPGDVFRTWDGRAD